MSQQSVVLMFLCAQLFAFPGALLFGWLAGKTSTKRAILISLAGWTVVSVGAYRLGAGDVAPFIAFGALAGLVQGGSVALSRSLYGSMIPEAASAEFFGFFSVFSKFSSIWGPLLFAFVSQTTGSSRLAILSIGSMFLIGGLLLAAVDVDEARASRLRWGFDQTLAPAPASSRTE
jgi:UMF1 family MFS transporter